MRFLFCTTYKWESLSFFIGTCIKQSVRRKIFKTGMKEMNLKNITLIALVACCLAQVGAQLFALSVVASTVSAAPPRSFAILQGDYRYDSSGFWSTRRAADGGACDDERRRS